MSFSISFQHPFNRAGGRTSDVLQKLIQMRLPLFDSHCFKLYQIGGKELRVMKTTPLPILIGLALSLGVYGAEPQELNFQQKKESRQGFRIHVSKRGTPQIGGVMFSSEQIDAILHELKLSNGDAVIEIEGEEGTSVDIMMLMLRRISQAGFKQSQLHLVMPSIPGEKSAEQPGAGQPATKPTDKPPVKEQPLAARVDENSVARCPIKTGVYRDGGSHFMKIPAYGEQPSIEIIRDGRSNKTTPGKYILANEYQYKGGKTMKVENVLRAFKQAESVLLSKYGKEYLFDLSMNPLELGSNVTTDEYLSRLQDSPFIERIDVSELLIWIQEYRRQHRTEPAGADQPATKPADKPPVKDQPSTPTSKDGPR